MAWKKFDSEEIDFTDLSINQFHVDTRDFHVATNTIVVNHPDINTLKKYNRFVCNAEKVLEILNYLYKESGGECKWRCLMTRMYPYWLKYLRIYRVDGKDQFIICDEYADQKPAKALRIDYLMSEVDKQHINNF